MGILSMIFEPARTLFQKSKENKIKLFNKYTFEKDLKKAIAFEEFILHYQPRVDAMSKEIVGAEALIRWIHPKLGFISPMEFIPLAEESELINDIGYWVIERVCRQLKEWKSKGCRLVPISINLSAKSLMKTDLVSSIMKYLYDYGIDPSLLEIEITENSILQNEAPVLSTIQLLRDKGISISLDDFGTGYSSIGYLKRFNVDYIKIDRSFIKDMVNNQADVTIVQSIILLAKGFNYKIVAEGVETNEQWGLLKKFECHYLQGFLFSEPLDVDRFTNSFLKLQN